MKSRIAQAMMIILFLLLHVSCDRVTKRIAREELEGKPPIGFLMNTVVLTYAENEGAFLGVLSRSAEPLRRFALRWLPLGVMAALTAYSIAGRNVSFADRLAIASIVGGGSSNLIDRFANGYVLDFLNFGIGPVRTGILNVADLSITAGAVFLCVRSMGSVRTKKRSPESGSPGENGPDDPS